MKKLSLDILGVDANEIDDLPKVKHTFLTFIFILASFLEDDWSYSLL
jgi:hypothetical protein